MSLCITEVCFSPLQILTSYFTQSRAFFPLFSLSLSLSFSSSAVGISIRDKFNKFSYFYRRSESYERIGERRNPPHGSAVNNDYSPMATLRSVATGYSSTEEYSSTARQSSTSGRGERAQNIRDDYDRER